MLPVHSRLTKDRLVAAVAVGLFSCSAPEQLPAPLGAPCVVTPDCATPFVCVEARCSVEQSCTCTTGRERCNGDNVEHCVDCTRFEVVQTCAGGCRADDPETVGCRQCSCDAGVRRCSFDGHIEGCSEDCQTFGVLETCAHGCEPSTTGPSGEPRCMD